MSKPRRRKKQDVKWFEHMAKQFRAISSVAVIVFFICYVLGAFIKIGDESLSYLYAGITSAFFLTIFNILRLIIKLEKKEFRRNFSVWHYLFLPIIFFLVGVGEFHIINHRDLYWIIFLILIVAVSLNVYEFSISVKGLWGGSIVSREQTLIQFVYLYVTTILSFTFIYLCLDPQGPYNLFKIDNSVDPLLDLLYLSVITATTVGYGDAVPITGLAKILIMLQTVVSYVFLSILIGLIVSWTGVATGRRLDTSHKK